MCLPAKPSKALQTVRLGPLDRYPRHQLLKLKDFDSSIRSTAYKSMGDVDLRL